MNALKLRPHEKIEGHAFHKTVTRSIHLFRQAEGYAVDQSQIEYFQQNGITELYFHEQDTGQTWRIDTAKFSAHGFSLRQGYGAQICCRLIHADALSPATVTQTAALPATVTQTAALQAAAEPLQPALFNLRQGRTHD